MGFWGSVVEAAGNVANGLFGFFGQQQTNASNEKINQKQLDLQREAWEREDSAVQRRMKDLEAAGLSPTLAAGSAASSSGPSVNLRANESPLSKLGNPADAVKAYRVAKMQERLNKAQVNLAEKQVEKEDATIKNIDEQTKGKAIENTYLDDMFKNRNLMFAEQYGGLTKNNILLDYELARTRKNFTWLDDDIKRERTIRDTILQQLEQSIKSKKLDDSIKLSNTLVNAFNAGANLYYKNDKSNYYNYRRFQ